MQEADGRAPVILSEYLRRYRQFHHFITGWQNDFVAPDTQWSIEDDRLAVQVIALRVLIGLEDHYAPLATLGDRSRQRYFDVVRRQICIGHERIFTRLRAADHCKVQRLPEHRVIDTLVTRRTALANGVVKE